MALQCCGYRPPSAVLIALPQSPPAYGRPGPHFGWGEGSWMFHGFSCCADGIARPPSRMQPRLALLLAVCVQKGSQLLHAGCCTLATTGTQASCISELINYKASMGPCRAHARSLSLPHVLPVVLWVRIGGGHSCLSDCILHSCWHKCATDVELRNPVSDIQQGRGCA